MKLVHWYREGRVFLFPPFGQNINKSNFKEKGGGAARGAWQGGAWQREGWGEEGRGGERGQGEGKENYPLQLQFFLS